MTPSESERDPRQSAIIVITALAHTICHMAELAFTGVLLQVEGEFGLSHHEGTTLAVLGFALMGGAAVPAGLWADAWSPLRVLRVFLVATAVCALAVALAPGSLGLFVTLTCLGLVGSLYHPAGLAVLSAAVPPQRRGRAMGINGVAGSVGVTLGPALGLFASFLGLWRLVYVAIAILAFGAAVYMMLTVRISDDEITPAPSAPAIPRTVPSPRPGWAALTLLFLAMTLGGFNYRGLMTALPPYLSEQTANGDKRFWEVLLVLTALGVGGVGQLACGLGADRLGARRIYPCLVTLLVPIYLALGLSGGGLLAFPVACAAAFCLFGQQPVENTIMAEWAPSRRQGLSYAFKFTVTFGVGAVGADVVGRLWDAYQSLAPAFYVLAGSSALMASLAALILWRTAPRGERACTPGEPEATMVEAVPAVPNG